jgi:hypothetical protein
MVTQDGAPLTSATPSRYYWLRSVAAAFVAAIVAILVSIVAHKQAWPYPRSIAFASFLFLIPVLQPIAQKQRNQSKASRLGLGVLFGLIGGFLHAFVLNR